MESSVTQCLCGRIFYEPERGKGSIRSESNPKEETSNFVYGLLVSTRGSTIKALE